MPGSAGIEPRLTGYLAGESEGIGAGVEGGLHAGRRIGEREAVQEGFHRGISSMIGGNFGSVDLLHTEACERAVVAIEPDHLPNNAPTWLPFDVDNEIDGLPNLGLNVGEGCL